MQSVAIKILIIIAVFVLGLCLGAFIQDSIADVVSYSEGLFKSLDLVANF